MATTLYCTMDEVTFVILGGSDAKPDQIALLRTALNAACRQIDKFCDRPDGFGKSTNTSSRIFVPENGTYVWTDDMADVAAITVKTDENGDGAFELTWNAVDYQLEPVNAPSKDEGRPYTALRAVFTKIFPLDYGAGSYLFAGGKRLLTPEGGTSGTTDRHTATVQIGGVKWGWPAIPSPIHDASIQQTLYLFKSFSAPFGVAGAGDVGEVRMLGEKLHPTARSLCADFRRNAGGAS